MSLPWSPWALEQIRKERPELTLKPVPHIDWVVVEFLKEHDVEARPVSFSDRTAGDVAMSGLMGAMGTFESAAWQGLKGQEKAVKAQEWTSWKQWALSHSDWSAFKEAQMGEPRRHNDEVERQLTDPAFVEEWNAKLKIAEQSRASEAKREALQIMLVGAGIALGIMCLAGLIARSINSSTNQNPPALQR